jgi:rRNA maturation RNase YbeY
MIQFNYETEFEVTDELKISAWISKCIQIYGFSEGEINYIFCDDEYLLKLNVEFLDHDTLTDIISFDYTLGKLISGDIFISVERVQDNALELNQLFENELHRVIIHGILHFIGFTDKIEEHKFKMRSEEDKCLEFLNLN